MRARVDASEPLIRQVYAMPASAYDAWAMTPERGVVSPRLFASDALESLTKMRASWVCVVWIPYVVCASASGIRAHRGSWVWCVMAFAVGALVVWPMEEYVVHRFAFHARGTRDGGRDDATTSANVDGATEGPVAGARAVIHYLAHGCHHKHPNDTSRLVMPLAVSLPAAAAHRRVARAFLDPALADLACAGVACGYVIYDILHVLMHDRSIRAPRFLEPWVSRRRRAHFAHHFGDCASEFGVTSSALDRAFGTAGASLRAKRVVSH